MSIIPSALDAYNSRPTNYTTQADPSLDTNFNIDITTANPPSGPDRNPPGPYGEYFTVGGEPLKDAYQNLSGQPGNSGNATAPPNTNYPYNNSNGQNPGQPGQQPQTQYATQPYPGYYPAQQAYQQGYPGQPGYSTQGPQYQTQPGFPGQQKCILHPNPGPNGCPCQHNKQGG